MEKKDLETRDGMTEKASVSVRRRKKKDKKCV